MLALCPIRGYADPRPWLCPWLNFPPPTQICLLHGFSSFSVICCRSVNCDAPVIYLFCFSFLVFSFCACFTKLIRFEYRLCGEYRCFCFICNFRKFWQIWTIPMSTFYNSRPQSVRNASMLLLIAWNVFAGVLHRPLLHHVCVCVCIDMYSIFDGNENVTDFLPLLQSCCSASCHMMIVSKSFVWSKNNYADERI